MRPQFAMPTLRNTFPGAFWALFLSLLLFGWGCDGAGDAGACDGNGSLALEAGSCLVFEDAGRLGANREFVEEVVRRTVSEVNDRMPVEDVRIRVVVDPAQVIPELGLSGYNPDAHEVILYLDPGSPVLSRSLANDLAPVLAHEMHHAGRRRTVGYGATLLEAMVSEGLADHFSMEVTGSAPPIWSQALKGEALETWLSRARATWTVRPYDHRGWFFGTDPEIPRWTGYAVGFEIVRRYLSDHPDRRASKLVSEVAGTFVPAGSHP